MTPIAKLLSIGTISLLLLTGATTDTPSPLNETDRTQPFTVETHTIETQATEASPVSDEGLSDEDKNYGDETSESTDWDDVDWEGGENGEGWTETFTGSGTMSITIEPKQLMEYIPDFVTTPEGGISWDVFNETIEHEYSYDEDDEFSYMGVRPEFSENIKKLEGSEVTIQGYMFPLEQGEKHTRFLLGPFPASCPYHYHVPPKFIIEVLTKKPAIFSYDAVNIKGTLELIPKDDEYNLFYRLKNAELTR